MFNFLTSLFQKGTKQPEMADGQDGGAAVGTHARIRGARLALCELPTRLIAAAMHALPPCAAPVRVSKKNRLQVEAVLARSLARSVERLGLATERKPQRQ